MYQNRNHVSPDVLASKGLRFANLVIDYIVRFGVGFILGVVIAVVSELTGNYAVYDFVVESEGRLSDYIFGLFILLIYYLTIEGLTARSIGKYVTKTKVVTHEGLRPDFGTILIRTLCRLIPFNALSFLGENGNGWHDSISKTYVVDINKFESKRETELGLEEIGKLPE